MQAQLDRWSLMWRICGLAALGVMLGLGINRAAADSACITNVADMMQLVVDAGSDCGCDCREPLDDAYTMSFKINSQGQSDGGTVTLTVGRAPPEWGCYWFNAGGTRVGDWEIGGVDVFFNGGGHCWEVYIVAYYTGCSEGVPDYMIGGYAYSDDDHPNPKGTYDGYGGPVEGWAFCADYEHPENWIRSNHPWEVTDIVIEKKH